MNTGAMLKLPLSPRDHVRGSIHAPVSLVEYGDFECRHCRHAYPIVRACLELFGDQVCFAFRHFPMVDVHPHAETAAQAAEAAAAQDRFWEMHDALFQGSGHLDRADLLALATHLELDAGTIGQALEARTYEARVFEDFRSGTESHVSGTPTFFINSARFDGLWELGDLQASIRDMLEAPHRS